MCSTKKRIRGMYQILPDHLPTRHMHHVVICRVFMNSVVSMVSNPQAIGCSVVLIAITIARIQNPSGSVFRENPIH
jgi:hypothetical protein